MSKTTAEKVREACAKVCEELLATMDAEARQNLIYNTGQRAAYRTQYIRAAAAIRSLDLSAFEEEGRHTQPDSEAVSLAREILEARHETRCALDYYLLEDGYAVTEYEQTLARALLAAQTGAGERRVVCPDCHGLLQQPGADHHHCGWREPARPTPGAQEKPATLRVTEHLREAANFIESCHAANADLLSRKAALERERDALKAMGAAQAEVARLTAENAALRAERDAAVKELEHLVQAYSNNHSGIRVG